MILTRADLAPGYGMVQVDSGPRISLSFSLSLFTILRYPQTRCLHGIDWRGVQEMAEEVPNFFQCI